MYFDASLILAFFLGALLAATVVWLLLAKRSKMLSLSLRSLESAKEQLSNSLSESKSHTAMLQERALHAHELKNELSKTRMDLDDMVREKSELSAKVAGLKAENEKAVLYFNQRINDLNTVHDAMKEAFSSISQEALLKNAAMINSSFKQSLDHFFMATEKDRMTSNESLHNIMKPLKESLVLVDKKVQELETTRQGAYSGLKERIEGLLSSQMLLQKETQNLARALNAPTIRGRWGEMQLRRVVELSGLSSHCDFVEQKNIVDQEVSLRPDMIVTLPKNKKIIIDAKAPLEIFGGDDTFVGKEAERGQELSLSLRRHLLTLKKKSYYSMLDQSPEFVVMFLPGEAFLHWALLADPSLLDYAAQNDVIIATPITLVALLKAIAFGFKQEAIAHNIEEVRRLSEQLITRINKVFSHFERLGKSLKQATDAYNQTLSSLDSRVLVTARKLSLINGLANEADEDVSSGLEPLVSTPRQINLEKNEEASS